MIAILTNLRMVELAALFRFVPQYPLVVLMERTSARIFPALMEEVYEIDSLLIKSKDSRWLLAWHFVLNVSKGDFD